MLSDRKGRMFGWIIAILCLIGVTFGASSSAMLDYNLSQTLQYTMICGLVGLLIGLGWPMLLYVSFVYYITQQLVPPALRQQEEAHTPRRATT